MIFTGLSKAKGQHILKIALKYYFAHASNRQTTLVIHWRKMSDWSIRDHVTYNKFNMAAKSSLVYRKKNWSPPLRHFLNGRDFLLFSFSSRSCEIRLPQCLRFSLPDATFISLMGYVSEKKMSKQTGRC